MIRPTAGTVARFRILTADGREAVGAVQGAGGVISRLDRLLAAQRMAEDGRETGLYEPEPGCVAVYPDFNAWSNGPEVVVSLVGATVEVSQ